MPVLWMMMAVYLHLLILVRRSADAVTIVDMDKDKTTNVTGAGMTGGKIVVMIDVMGVEMLDVTDGMRMAEGNVAIATVSRAAAEDLPGCGENTTG